MWLWAGCTQRGGGGGNQVLPAVHHPLTPLHPPDDVHRKMIGKVRGDLPALAGPDPGVAEMAGTLAGALRALTGARVAAEVGDGTPREATSLQEVYRETYSNLLQCCNVAATSGVAPVGGRLANCTKSERHTILVQEFNVCAWRKGCPQNRTPPLSQQHSSRWCWGSNLWVAELIASAQGCNLSSSPKPATRIICKRLRQPASVTNYPKATKTPC
jgi:hypothetical protein